MTHPQPEIAPIHLALGKSVLGVELYDLVANKKLFTFHRKGSRCTFTEAIRHGDYELTLRLDWGELQDGDPTLDLDVTRLQPGGTRKLVKPSRNPRHHTSLSNLLPNSKEPQVYDLEYEGLTMRLVARKAFAMSVGLSIYVVDSNEAPAGTPE